LAETLHLNANSDKDVRYEDLIPQINALVSGETDTIANLANIAAALKQAFGFFWVGFYIVRQEELILGPFQGPIACTRIQMGRGVCGTSWQNKKTILVPDVDAFPGHIACSSDSKSEIVVPIIRNNVVLAVLDVDSDQLNDFTEVDQKWLEQLCQPISEWM